MASMHDLTRAPDLMTDEERTDLLSRGWQAEVIDSLHTRGFRPCKPDYISARFDGIDPGRMMGFLRQTAVPHLSITIHREAVVTEVLEAIDTAIFEAGRMRGHESLAGDFMRFFNRCKTWQPSPDLAFLEKRLAALEEAKNQET